MQRKRPRRKGNVEQLDRLEEIAARQGCVIYAILHRRAGWGIEWHDQKREENPDRHPSLLYRGEDSWKNGLVVYRYYDTFDEMLQNELERLSERETARSQ